MAPGLFFRSIEPELADQLAYLVDEVLPEADEDRAIVLSRYGRESVPTDPHEWSIPSLTGTLAYYEFYKRQVKPAVGTNSDGFHRLIDLLRYARNWYSHLPSAHVISHEVQIAGLGNIAAIVDYLIHLERNPEFAIKSTISP